MSTKKKNPLKDLSAFLAHQEEAAEVTKPKRISEADAFLEKKPTQIAGVGRPSKITVAAEANTETVLKLLKELANKDEDKFRNEFYEMITQVVGNLKESTSQDKMLINTALYLSNQENWKEVVKKYWNDN